MAQAPATAAGVGDIATQAARRRTFAIVSHPDAGKTTTTEKLLLYAGALERAGSVKARSGQSQTTSDWMEFERRRGISITATALQFPHGGLEMTLLDTPGHHDFSEDTLRVMSAADCVVVLLDASPAGPRAARTARLDRGRRRAAGGAAQLAGRRAGRPARPDRAPRGHLPALRAHRPRRDRRQRGATASCRSASHPRPASTRAVSPSPATHSASATSSSSAACASSTARG